MTRLALLLLLCACTTPLAPAPGVPLAEGLIARTSATPPARPEGACWAADTTPAVIETVTEQVLAEPETRAPDGSVLTAATFRTVTQQRILQDRRDVWFRTPCAADLTPETIATLQRALKARGFYLGPLTGVMDTETRRAIRSYQEPRGLDSETLSLEAARSLGVIAGDFDP